MLEQVNDVIRLKHHSDKTEKSLVNWIKRNYFVATERFARWEKNVKQKPFRSMFCPLNWRNPININAIALFKI
jgi:hypothetical protein